MFGHSGCVQEVSQPEHLNCMKTYSLDNTIAASVKSPIQTLCVTGSARSNASRLARVAVCAELILPSWSPYFWSVGEPFVKIFTSTSRAVVKLSMFLWLVNPTVCAIRHKRKPLISCVLSSEAACHLACDCDADNAPWYACLSVCMFTAWPVCAVRLTSYVMCSSSSTRLEFGP